MDENKTYEKFIEDNRLKYQILEMKFEKGKSNKEIAASLNKSIGTIIHYYTIFSWNLYRCYYKYLKSIGLEVDTTDILNFYENISYAVAYLEEEYSESLELFRGGKPPNFLGNIKNVPPYRKLTEGQLLDMEKNIVNAREIQGRTYIDIGQELKITREKTRYMYEYYYHRKIKKFLDGLEIHVRRKLYGNIIRYSNYSHITWDMIVREYADFIQE